MSLIEWFPAILLPTVRGPYGPSLPPMNWSDCATELQPVSLNQVLLRVRAEHMSHKLDWPMYYYAEGDCIHYAGISAADGDESEDYEAQLLADGLHLSGEDGYLCTEQPADFGCQECESSECERVGELESMVEDFWALFEVKA